MRLLDDVNRGSADAVQQLSTCNASRRWVDGVLAGRPYADADHLLAGADDLARTLEWDDVCEALHAHPRIGDRATGDSREAALSRHEQSSVGTADPQLRVALAEGNSAYERRFGTVFLIRAAGRGPDEMLAELQRRLGNDEPAERAEVTEQLAQITRLRLERVLGPAEEASR